MTYKAIADSDATDDPERIFSQHHAALSLLGQKLSLKGSEKVLWLDVGCGKGQIIAQLERNFQEEERKKLHYHGFDINSTHIAVAVEKALKLNLADHHFCVCATEEFSNKYDVTKKYDFVTITNLFHELSPFSFSKLLIDVILRLSENGTLYIFDMESLERPEIGAVTFEKAEIGEYLGGLLKDMGMSGSNNLMQFRHKSCSSWQLTLDRAQLKISDQDLVAASESLIHKANDYMKGILERKIKAADESLEVLMVNKEDTPQEKTDSRNYIYQYWSVYNRLKEVGKL